MSLFSKAILFVTAVFSINTYRVLCECVCLGAVARNSHSSAVHSLQGDLPPTANDG